MFTKNSFNGKADPVADAIKAIAEADYALKVEALKGGQVQLDKNKNNKLDAQDFKILRGKKKVEEADEKPRSAGSVFDKDVAKSFEKKKPGETTGHDSKKTSTGTQYTKKAPVEESLASFKDKLKAGAKKVARVMGGPDDEGHKKDLQKKMGIPQTGKPNHAKYNEEVKDEYARKVDKYLKKKYKKEEVELDEEFVLEEIDPALVEEFMQTEEFEQLDELSKGTLASYVKKSSDDLGYHAARVAGGVKDVARHGGKNTQIGKELQKDVEKSVNIRDKRSSGIDKAATKLSKEEVEEISELKKSTLASYVKKAAKDSVVQGFAIGDAIKSKNWSAGAKAGDKSKARVKGVERAADRLAKEEVEELSELSKGTLDSYVTKARDDNKSNADSRRSGDEYEAKYAKDRFNKRGAGITAAKQRLNKEEAEELSELSKGTLASYERKATTNAVDNMVKGKTFMDIADRIKARKPSAVGKDLIKRAEKEQGKAQHKVNNRVAGMVKANARLKREEVELDEALRTNPLGKERNRWPDSDDKLPRKTQIVQAKDKMPEKWSDRNLATRVEPMNKPVVKKIGASVNIPSSMKKEEVEDLSELTTQTLSSYIKKRGSELRGGYEDKDKIKGMNAALRKIKQNGAKKD